MEEKMNLSVKQNCLLVGVRYIANVDGFSKIVFLVVVMYCWNGMEMDDELPSYK